MSPKKSKNDGGSVGRAASSAAHRRGAARTDDLRMLAPGLAMLVCAVTVLVFTAPELWPHLFAY